MNVPRGTIYSVKDWDDLFENAASRKLKALAWVPVPNSHNSVAYARLITSKGGTEIFAAWVLIVQLASRCAHRGVLASSDGRPYDAHEMAIKTRAPAAIFTRALPYLVDIGWLDCTPAVADSADVLADSADVLADNGMTPALNRIELKGTEKKTNTTAQARRWCEIYAAYPRKIGRKASEHVIRQAIQAKGFEELLQAVQAFARATTKVEKRYIPHPATWFRQGRYDDDPGEWGVNADGRLKMPPGNNTADARMERLEKETRKI